MLLRGKRVALDGRFLGNKATLHNQGHDPDVTV